MPLNPTAPAPASDATLAAAPPFVAFNDTWDDPEWREAAATPAGARTEAQNYLYAGGPRPHPWGATAFVGPLPDPDGRMAFWPSRAAYDAYRSRGVTPPPPAAAQSTLGAINAGLAAAAGTPQLEDERLEAAAPKGAAASRPPAG